ncbi:MAG: YitT family protein [Clostridia bacterium]
MVIGSAMTAIAINMFLSPNRIAPGGVSGIGIIVYYLFHFPVGISMLVMNIPLFIVGIRHMGGIFGIKTLFSTVLLSIIIDSTTFLPVVTRDPLLASIYGGIIMGAGLGLVFHSGATTGGTDLAAKIVHKFMPSITLGQILLAIDFGVIVFAAIVFKDYELALYAIITLFAASQVIDALLEGVNFAKVVFIVSNKSGCIAERIMKELDRGVTGLDGTGMYTGQDKTVLMCILRRAEIPMLKSIVKEVDNNAFVILSDAREVLGEGFKSYE